MIVSLSGTVKEINTNSISIEVSGIGFGVFVPRTEIFSIGSVVSLEIVFYWNQENGPQLFGFNNRSEKVIFNLLISCSGCGPKIGLAAVAQVSPSDFIGAIVQGDINLLSSVNGIGKKKAEQIILQLKDKIASIDKNTFELQNTLILDRLKQIHEALGSLGYSRVEIQFAIDQIKKQFKIEEEVFEQLLRKCLNILAKKL